MTLWIILKKKIGLNYLYFYYDVWSQSHPIDKGTTSRKAFIYFDFHKFNIKNKKFNTNENQIFMNNKNYLSNGFLMRKSTLITWIYYRFYKEKNCSFSSINDNTCLLELYKKVKEISNIDNRC